MLKRKITTTGNSAALVLSQDVLALMGIGVGDEVELQLIDRTLVVRPVDEAGRSQRVREAIDDVLVRRRDLLARLAEGAGEEPGERR
jgi:antitoxin component of MazEF toxin-antitoxin module